MAVRRVVAAEAPAEVLTERRWVLEAMGEWEVGRDGAEADSVLTH